MCLILMDLKKKKFWKPHVATVCGYQEAPYTRVYTYTEVIKTVL